MIEVCSARSLRVWRTSTGPLTASHFDMRQGYRVKVMLWGSMSSRGLGPVTVVDGTMNTDKYLDILTTHLLRQASIWYPSGDWIFPQDGARCHTSSKARQYFENLEIPLLPWTPNSPDFNPIENVWCLVFAGKESVSSGSSE